MGVMDDEFVGPFIWVIIVVVSICVLACCCNNLDTVLHTWRIEREDQRRREAEEQRRAQNTAGSVLTYELIRDIP